MQRIDFLGCPIDSLTMDDAIGRVCEFIASGKPHVVAVANANKLWLMAQLTRLRQVVLEADLIIPEYAIVWGAARLGTPVREHIGGSMLLEALLPRIAARGHRPFFLGARPEVVELLAQRLANDYPGLSIAGYHHGYFHPENGAVIAAIRRVQPDILFVALGSPKQEYWIAENKDALGVPVCFGVGGSFDVLAGVKSDAPSWARSRGLEWLYRLGQDPKAYWQRYLITNSWFVWQVLKAKIGCARST